MLGEITAVASFTLAFAGAYLILSKRVLPGLGLIALAFLVRLLAF